MSPRLTISHLVVERLKKLEKDSYGNLFGIASDKDITVLGFTLLSQKQNEKNENNPVDIVSNFPASINICGVFRFSDKDVASSIESDLLDNVEGIPVILDINTSSSEIKTYLYEDDSFNKLEHAVANGTELSKSFLYFRITATIPLSCDFEYENLTESFSVIEKKIASGNAAFQFDESDIYTFGESSDNISKISADSTVDELYTMVHQASGNKNKTPFNVLNVSMYLKSTNNDTSPQLAPVIKHVKKVYKHVEIQLSLDTLAVAPKQLKMKDLHVILTESCCRNLKLNEDSILNQLKSGNLRNVSLPQTYHFFLEYCGHFFSVVYPVKQSLEQLKKIRETFHSLLALPTDKPLLRQSNAIDFANTFVQNTSNCLINPHEGLGASGVPDGEPCFVQGKYAYHHYMQDKFDDNGWGCAYRSLQTVFSWFRLQGYTNIPIPSHKDIQQCLVNIGDKPQSFIGSKQWIGSTEVSFVLDTMLGVTCRIVSVSSGEEMSMKGGELSYHFKTQGTPVMIGGGVLAHTIIGVDYNKKTGAIKFLILDPHYTGGEDLKLIQNKGWCGWKGPEFWKKDAFYNMCLPLRPKCV